ncbi:MAG: NADH-quinone oxidoreductase subunit M [Bacillota bacterium]
MLLTLAIFIPLAGAAVVALWPRQDERGFKVAALVSTAIPLVISIWMATAFQPGAGMQFTERAAWVPSLGINYILGVDGISFPMVFLTALLTFLACLASWHISPRPKDYFALLLLLETGMMGVFCALDYVLFYVFWELVLVPMYFLIGIWGGPRREYAAIKFFIYTLLGSVVMLVGILAMYFAGAQALGHPTFDMMALQQVNFPFHFQLWVFAALYLGFAVKVPIFPFHTWLPDAHVEAPTAVSVLLAGILLKMGTYGFMRVSLPTFPEAASYFAYAIAVLGVISMIYGAFVAMWQADLKKLVAYSSVSHMGYVMLGIAAGTPMALSGAIFQMFSHGMITGMLFLLVGMIYDRAHTREIAKLSGLYTALPAYGIILAFASFASLGLPGLSGFVAELLVLLGSFPVYRTLVIIGAATIVITAGYMLWMMQRVLMGKSRPELEALPDVTGRELATVIPLIVLIAVLGVFPRLLLDFTNPALIQLAARVGGM